MITIKKIRSWLRDREDRKLSICIYKLLVELKGGPISASKLRLAHSLSAGWGYAATVTAEDFRYIGYTFHYGNYERIYFLTDRGYSYVCNYKS